MAEGEKSELAWTTIKIRDGGKITTEEASKIARSMRDAINSGISYIDWLAANGIEPQKRFEEAFFSFMHTDKKPQYGSR